MYKSLTGIAAAAAAATTLYLVAAPTPADALVARHAPGIQVDQSNVEPAQWRRHRRWYGPRYYRRVYRYPYAYGPYPYAYAAPYPYYRRYYYGPQPFVRFGPFGLGVW